MHASLKQLRYFIMVAECGKVAEASKRLHISQPALSAAIAQLEDTWQIQLFVRHKAQGVTLTSNGELLLRYSRQLLQQAHALDDYARELNLKVAGEIHIGCFSTLAPLFIPKLLKAAKTQYPDLTIHMHEGDIAQVHADIFEGRIELGLSYSLGHDARLSETALMRCPPYVLLPELHALSKQKMLTLQQLEHEPMILLDLPHSREYFTSLFASAGFEPKIIYRSANFEMVRSMVGAGLGFSLLNQKPNTKQTYNGSAVKMLPLREGNEHALQIVIARHAEVKMSVRAEAVMVLIWDLASASS
jgi:DNA-binding transcriptional LysR family regulator